MNKFTRFPYTTQLLFSAERAGANHCQHYDVVLLGIIGCATMTFDDVNHMRTGFVHALVEIRQLAYGSTGTMTKPTKRFIAKAEIAIMLHFRG